MPSTIHITHDKSGNHALSYANSNKRKPHNVTKTLDKRVLMSGYVGCTAENYRDKFNNVWKKADARKRGLIETYTIRQSFDPSYNYNNPADVKKVNAMGVALAERLYPNHLCVVATQADGYGHKLHNHIVVCNQNTLTGKCLRSRQKNFSFVSAQNDYILRKFGDTPAKKLQFDGYGRVTNTAEKIDLKAIEQARPYVYKTGARKGQTRLAHLTPKEQIKSAFQKSIDSGVSSFTDFQQEMRKNGVDVIFRYTKQGKLRKRISYNIGRNSHNFSSYNLGEKYGRDGLTELLEQNKQRQKQEAITTIANGFQTAGKDYSKRDQLRRKRRNEPANRSITRKIRHYPTKPIKPDESDEQRKRKYAERLKAIEEYKRKFRVVKPLTDYSRQTDWFNKWWYALLNTTIVDELRKILAEPTKSKRNDRNQSIARENKTADKNRDELDYPG